VAKISRINIAITGDSKGLQAATDSARRELNRLNAAAEQTSKKLKGFGESAMRVQGVAGQFGIRGTGLGAVGGLAQLGAMGGMGLGLGAAGLALGAGALGVSAVQGLPDVRRRAIAALEETSMDQRRRIEELGFSRQVAQAIAANASKASPAASMGLMESFQQGLATQKGGIGEFLINEAPKVFGTQLGALMGGASLEQAGKLGLSQMDTGDSLADLQKATTLMNSMPGWTYDVLRWISK
jgi:hypothetical protein